MSTLVDGLVASILAAERAARWTRFPARAQTDDVFRLDLPPLPSPGGGDIDGQSMEVLGGLYLIAQLEQTGMLRAAEVLAEQRMLLDLRSLEAAELLDEFARTAESWYDAAERNHLFARVFGIGPAARSDPVVNHGFETVVVELCAAIVAWSDAAYFDRPPASRRTSSVTTTVRALRSNLAPRQYGNTLTAAQRLADQTRLTYELLSHPGIIELVVGRTLWDVVRALWGDDAPDIDRFVTLGQSGQLLLGWVGTSGAESGEPTSTSIDAAVSWLMAMNHSIGAAA